MHRLKRCATNGLFGVVVEYFLSKRSQLRVDCFVGGFQTRLLEFVLLRFLWLRLVIAFSICFSNIVTVRCLREIDNCAAYVTSADILLAEVYKIGFYFRPERRLTKSITWSILLVYCTMKWLLRAWWRWTRKATSSMEGAHVWEWTRQAWYSILQFTALAKILSVWFICTNTLLLRYVSLRFWRNSLYLLGSYHPFFFCVCLERASVAVLKDVFWN